MEFYEKITYSVSCDLSAISVGTGTSRHRHRPAPTGTRYPAMSSTKSVSYNVKITFQTF